MKYKGNYVAAPVNVHRVNWLWANPRPSRRPAAKLPTTWDEFFVAAETLKKAGITPVAHGGQNWQDFTTFESVALGVGGPSSTSKALVELDQAALNSPTMPKTLETVQQGQGLHRQERPGPRLEPGHGHGDQGRSRACR